MTIRSPLYRRLGSLGLLVLAGLILPAQAQSIPKPDREQLLNGLPVLFWQRPSDANVLLKLRVNSGAAFDLAGKVGTMALLGDALFPDPSTREYVTEELGGRLEVVTSYDTIDITISGKATHLERLIELLRNAIINLNLSAENVARLREARLAQLPPTSASQTADRAIAARLFGSFPYARPIAGDADDLAKIERADLMLAQERFLHSDNATLVVIGGVDRTRLMRALRQLLGPWQKGDRSIPATFRQPNSPDERTLLINRAGAKNVEIRLAVRGLARTDRDALIASLLAQIARERWLAAVPELSPAVVRHEAHALPGMFVFSASVPPEVAAKAFASAQEVMKGVAQNGVSAAELDRARNVLLAEIGKTSSDDLIANAWLDLETYKIPLAINDATEIGRVTLADVQRVATRLFVNANQAKVVVADADQLRSALGAKVEIRNDEPKGKSASEPASLPRKP